MGGWISVEMRASYGLLILPPPSLLEQTKDILLYYYHNAAYLCTVCTSLHVN